MKKLTLLLALAALALSQELKEVLTQPQHFKKGSLTIQKDAEQYVGKFTLEVKKGEGSEMLQLIAVDPVKKKEEIIVLYDNGLHGDEIAGDGVYSGTTFIMPGSEQKYYLGNRNSKYDTQVLFEYVLFKW